MRPAAVLGGGALVAAALGVAVVTGVLPSPATGSPAPSTTPGAADPQVRTAPVERRTMQTAAELDGTLGYEEARDVQAGTDGMLTRRPAVGTVIRRNGVLYELDGRVRPRLFYGTRPMWRELRPGITDGADILQLERNLRALGYAPKGMKVNRHWDAKTTRAVKRWQKATGRTRDGSLDDSDIAFLPGAIRVSAHPAEIGLRVGPGTPVLGTTGATRVVTLDIAASRLDLLPEGMPVTVTLPDETRVAGTVSRVGREVTAGQDGGSATVTVTIALDPDA
ncbi:MAG TPA: peptidoglycan-binding protein, partial [Candidatus Limnocylindrales bacterium]|nr:peptidoglycan-binding protein [Candidatus Limnocylindrales bacterium]